MGIQSIISNIKNACRVLVNGDSFNVTAGGDVNINGNRVTIGGKTVQADGPVIKITVEGDVEKVYCDGGDVTVNGNVGGDVDVSAGNVTVGGDVNGDIDTSAGNIKVSGNVAGDIDCSCGNITVGGKHG